MLIAIGDQVVELEIEHHRDHRGDRLFGLEPQHRGLVKQAEGEQMNHDTKRANQGEGEEAQRQQAAKDLIQQQAAELDLNTLLTILGPLLRRRTGR